MKTYEALATVGHQPELLPVTITGNLSVDHFIAGLKTLPAGDLVGVRPAADGSPALELFPTPQSTVQPVRVEAALDTSGSASMPCVWVYRGSLLENLRTMKGQYIGIEMCPDDTPKLVDSYQQKSIPERNYYPRTDNEGTEPRASLRLYGQKFRVRLSGKIASAPVAPVRPLAWSARINLVDLGAIHKGIAAAATTKDYLPYVFIEPSTDEIRLLATDSYRMHVADVQGDMRIEKLQPVAIEMTCWKSIIKHIPTLTKQHMKQPHLAPLIELRCEQVEEDKYALVVKIHKVGSDGVSSLEVPASVRKVPPYASVLASLPEFPICVTVEHVDELVSALNRIKVYARENAFACRYSLKKKENTWVLHLSGGSDKHGIAEAEITLMNTTKANETDGTLNVDYLKDAAQWAVQDNAILRLKFIDKRRPVMFELGYKRTGWGVLMPMVAEY